MASDHKVGTILTFISGVGIGAKVALCAQGWREQ
jgi:hypothetical protein